MVLLTDLATDQSVLTELGARLERHRLERNLTQAELAELAGIGRATLQRLERGESVQMTSMVKLLRALGLLAALDTAIPPTIDLPIAQLEREQARRDRRRATGRRAAGHGRRATSPPSGGKPWTWGDEGTRP